MPEFPDTSESLIIQVRDSADRVAWERFEQLYRPVIFRIACAKGLQHADALDLVQQVLLSVADAIPRYEKREEATPFRNWLNRITRNAIVKALSRAPRDRASGGTEVLDVLHEVPSSDAAIEALIEQEYQREIYTKAASVVRLEVADTTWLAFEMTVLQSRSIEKAASSLGISTGSVYAAALPSHSAAPRYRDGTPVWRPWQLNQENTREDCTLNKIKHRCNTTQIDSHLAGRLDADQQAEFEAHLTECESCRERLQEQAASQEVWENARSLLSNGHDLDVEETSGPSSSDCVQPGIKVLDALAPTDDPEMLGRLGEYEISGVVGIGGMGAVLRGFDKSLRRVVAIKVMAPHLAGSGPARTRFQREARAAAAITQDNIIEIYGVAESNGLPYIVMPFARGPSLQNRIDRSGPLTSVEVVRIGKQIASGLAAAHEQGLVHRDIKPANILLNEGIERLWITDFGVARAMDDASMTRTGVIAGTPQYMSPEQARGESVDHRSDLFSLGSVLYTACTGRVPFRSEAAYGILRRITDTDPRPIREINPDIPEWLSRVINRLMSKHPGDRFQTAAEVSELLEGCLAHLQQPINVELPPCIATPDSSREPLDQAPATQVAVAGGNNRKSRWSRPTILAFLAPLFLAMLGAVAWQATAPVDLSGTWKGDVWTTVSLTSVKEASGWYSGTFTDDKGNQGAIQLEWSRLQRRYNGRWKSGNDQSGAITLRAAQKEQVRGAVSADPEASVPAESPRLRDFSWRRTNASALTPLVGQSLALQESTDELPEWRQFVGKPQSITAPEKGIVSRLGDGVRENARLEKGTLIAVLSPLDDESKRRLETELNTLEQHLDESKAAVVTKKNEIKVAITNVEASKQRQASYERVQREIVAGADAAIEVEANNIEIAESNLAALKASADQTQKLYDHIKAAREKGLVSLQEIQSAEAQLKSSNAKVAAAEATVRSATNAMLIKQKDRNAKEARAQVDIDDAKASVSNAMTSVAEAEAELAIAQSKVVKAEQQVAEIRMRLNQVERLNIVAAQNGYVSKLGIRAGQTVKQGDVLCIFWPEQTESGSMKPTSPLTPPSENSVPPYSSEASILNSLPPRTEESGPSLMTALETATNIAKRIRVCQSELKAVEASMSSNPQSAAEKSAQRSLTELRRRLSTLQKDKSTIIDMLETRRDSARQLQKSQADLTGQMVAAADAGAISQHELIVSKHSLAATNRELAFLDQLLVFYEAIGKVDEASERKSIIEILKKQMTFAQELCDLQATITTQKRFAFERGKLSIDEELESQQALTRANSQKSELELLLRYYTETDAPQSPKLPNLGGAKKANAESQRR